MTTDSQRDIIAARLTGLYGQEFMIDTYSDKEKCQVVSEVRARLVI